MKILFQCCLLLVLTFHLSPSFGYASSNGYTSESDLSNVQGGAQDDRVIPALDNDRPLIAIPIVMSVYGVVFFAFIKSFKLVHLTTPAVPSQ